MKMICAIAFIEDSKPTCIMLFLKLPNTAQWQSCIVSYAVCLIGLGPSHACMHLLELPEEILLEIVRFAKGEDALELVKVSRLPRTNCWRADRLVAGPRLARLSTI
jgi:hypothetical protein